MPVIVTAPDWTSPFMYQPIPVPAGHRSASLDWSKTTASDAPGRDSAADMVCPPSSDVCQLASRPQFKSSAEAGMK